MVGDKVIRNRLNDFHSCKLTQKYSNKYLILWFLTCFLVCKGSFYTKRWSKNS